MNRLNNLLDEYARSHQNKYNIFIHKICVPLILWSIIVFIYYIPLPSTIVFNHFTWNFILIICFLLLFYLSFGIVSFLIMFLELLLILISINFAIIYKLPLLKIAIGLFIVAWILQFIGHLIEGKKPSFFKNIQFLLIGPLWLFLGRKRYI